jgi:hypothetical protein
LQYLSSLNPIVIEDPVAPANQIRFVRVRLSNVNLTSFFANIVDIDIFNVSASAVAGPGPPLTSNVCNLVPILVCAKSPEVTDTSFYGFEPGDIQLLKIGAGSDSPVGAGNYQLLDLDGSGGADVRQAMAGANNQCYTAPESETLMTQPGNEVGPVSQGLNTRFGIYRGPVSSTDFSPDIVIVDPASNTNNSEYTPYSENNMSPSNPYRYSDYLDDVAGCLADSTGEDCSLDGQPQRRLLTIAVGQCSGVDNGVSEIPMYGFGCFFLPQSVRQSGRDGDIFGEFVKGCTFGDGGFGPTPPDGDASTAPRPLVLYKDPDGRDA